MMRLLIVADHSLVVHTIKMAIRQTAGFQVVDCLDGHAPAADALVEQQPDVVVVDDMEQPDVALSRLCEVATAAPHAQCLLLTLRMDPRWLREVFEAGAHTVVSKTVHPVSLGTLLREVVRGNVVHRADLHAGAQDPCPLTERELEILRLAGEGHTNGEIARALWLSNATVKFHLSKTYRKLGVANRTEATRYAHLNPRLKQVMARERVPA